MESLVRAHTLTSCSAAKTFHNPTTSKHTLLTRPAMFHSSTRPPPLQTPIPAVHAQPILRRTWKLHVYTISHESDTSCIHPRPPKVSNGKLFRDHALPRQRLQTVANNCAPSREHSSTPRPSIKQASRCQSDRAQGRIKLRAMKTFTMAI